MCFGVISCGMDIVFGVVVVVVVVDVGLEEEEDVVVLLEDFLDTFDLFLEKNGNLLFFSSSSFSFDDSCSFLTMLPLLLLLPVLLLDVTVLGCGG